MSPKVESGSDPVDENIRSWQLSRTCVDYIVYSHSLPIADAGDWKRKAERLRGLGLCQDTAIGVVTVRGEWGFFQIPLPGFPELKVTFFQVGTAADRRRLLELISDILEEDR